MSSEVLGVLHGEFHDLQPGVMNVATSFMPHGESYETYKKATTAPLSHTRVQEDGAIGFMLHIGFILSITSYALERAPLLEEECVANWGSFKADFLEHLEEVEAETPEQQRPQTNGFH